jgi:hypothetical protein
MQVKLFIPTKMRTWYRHRYGSVLRTKTSIRPAMHIFKIYTRYSNERKNSKLTFYGFNEFLNIER